MCKESIISRIDKLFKLAGNNPSIKESEAAMLKAQELMLKHGLESKDIEVKIESISAEERKVNQKTKKTKWFETSLVSVIAKNFRCRSFTRTSQWTNTKVNILVGLPDDVEVAHMVSAQAISHLNENVKLWMKLWKKHFPQEMTCNPKNGIPFKNDFIIGYIEGLKAKFAEQVADMKFELMIVTPHAVMTHLEALNLKRSRASSVNVTGFNGAREAGRDTGRSFTPGAARRIA